jgi:outer membrane lipase/esterase
MLKQLILKIGLFLFWLLPIPACAQIIDKIRVFGDSFSSTFYQPGGIIPSVPPYFDGRFSNGPVWIEGFSTEFKLPPATISNFAVGGANSRRGNSNLPGLRLQIDRSLQASPTSNSNELVVIWSGSNDYPGNGSSPASVVKNILTGVQRFVDVGAQQFIVPNLDPPLQVLPGSPNLVKKSEVVNLIADHNQTLNASLQKIAQANPQLSIVPTDIYALFEAVAANPGRFGFANADLPCIDPLTGAVCANPDRYFFWDEATHPTAAGHKLISAYSLDTLTAKGAIAAQTETALGSASQQTRDVNDRLLAIRTGNVPTEQPVRIFVQGGSNFGDRSTTDTNVGFNIDSKSVTVGADYPLTSQVAVGLAFSATNTNNQLVDNRGKVSLSNTSISAYGSYIQQKFYSDVLVNYGWSNFTVARNIRVPGFTQATANPTGNQLSVRVNSGYDLGASGISFGPIVGLRYTKVNIGGYTEQNGDILNLKVNPQAAESLIFNIGAQVSYPFKVSFGKIAPYATANFEREFSQNDRQIVTELVTQPGIPIRSKITANDREFIRLSTGIQTEFTNSLAATLGYETVVGKNNFSDNYLHAKLQYQF